MNWREAYRHLAANFARRSARAGVAPGGPSDEYSRGLEAGKRFAWDVVAREAEYIASLPAAEGAAAVRALGGRG